MDTTDRQMADQVADQASGTVVEGAVEVEEGETGGQALRSMIGEGMENGEAGHREGIGGGEEVWHEEIGEAGHGEGTGEGIGAIGVRRGETMGRHTESGGLLVADPGQMVGPGPPENLVVIERRDVDLIGALIGVLIEVLIEVLLHQVPLNFHSERPTRDVRALPLGFRAHCWHGYCYKTNKAEVKKLRKYLRRQCQLQLLAAGTPANTLSLSLSLDESLKTLKPPNPEVRTLEHQCDNRSPSLLPQSILFIP
jgi:hypothetical protein